MAINAFLKFEGGNPTIEGSSLKQDHETDIEILAYSFGVSNSGTRHTSTGGGGAGLPNIQDVTVTFATNKASPALWISGITGNHFDKVTLFGRRVGGSEAFDFFELRMSDAIITSYQTSASSGQDEPTESISINFAQVEYVFREQEADGAAGGDISQSFDIAKAST